MTTTSARLLLWTPRLLGILMCVFLGLFALDEFDEAKSLRETLLAFGIHVAPALLLLAIVVVSWRWEWVGGIAFLTLAVGYLAIANERIDWILIISGPLAAIGTLFFSSWRFHSHLHAHRG